ncbi:hypothetical protein [Tateyamaria sp. SN3-11]
MPGDLLAYDLNALERVIDIHLPAAIDAPAILDEISAALNARNLIGEFA